MLSRNPAGRLTLEDGEASVPLEMQDAVPGEGLYTEGCMVLVEGEYTVDETVRVLAMGHPPSEKRDVARWVRAGTGEAECGTWAPDATPPHHARRAIYGHVDFLGSGAISLTEEARFAPVVAAHADVNFVVLSDVWLDHPKTLPSLQRLFDGYAQAEVRPFAFVLCGNFSSVGWEGQGGIERYKGAPDEYQHNQPG